MSCMRHRSHKTPNIWPINWVDSYLSFLENYYVAEGAGNIQNLIGDLYVVCYLSLQYEFGSTN